MEIQSRYTNKEKKFMDLENNKEIAELKIKLNRYISAIIRYVKLDCFILRELLPELRFDFHRKLKEDLLYLNLSKDEQEYYFNLIFEIDRIDSKKEIDILKNKISAAESILLNKLYYTEDNFAELLVEEIIEDYTCLNKEIENIEKIKKIIEGKNGNK